MSKLDELIAQLCPDGVKYRIFGESATIVRGASPRPIKNFITTESTGVNWIKIGGCKKIACCQKGRFYSFKFHELW